MTCRDCIHHVVCNRHRPDLLDIGCEDFSDRSAWVNLPCKVGTTVFFVREQTDGKKLDIGKISSFGIDRDNDTWIFVRYESDLLYWWHSITDLNKTVFFSREEAKRALKERESNEK